MDLVDEQKTTAVLDLKLVLDLGTCTERAQRDGLRVIEFLGLKPIFALGI